MLDRWFFARVVVIKPNPEKMNGEGNLCAVPGGHGKIHHPPGFEVASSWLTCQLRPVLFITSSRILESHG